MGTETELKLALAAADISTLLQNPLLAAPPKRQRLHNTYFDTVDLALTRRKVAVRERRILRKTLLTVKTAAESHGGVSQRSEWEAPTTPGQFDFATLVDDIKLADELGQLAPQLVPIFTTDFTRRSWTLNFRRAVIEVALDQGSIATQRDQSQREQPICEVELELKSGQPVALFALARMLSRNVRLHPADDSKAVRGYRLFLNQIISPRKALPVHIQGSDRTIQVFKHIAQSCIAHLQANEGGVLLPQDEEYVHQARVAMRRLRTALRLFSAALPQGFSERWSNAWRNIAQELGNARNWDVFCSELLPLLDKDLKAHPDLKALRAFALDRRLQSHESAKACMTARSYSLTLISFCEALMDLRVVDEPISTFATKALKRRHRKFVSGARIAHTLTAGQRHEVRIDLKKLRYTLDFFESLYPKKRVQAFSRALTDTQELLGHMNDLATADLLMHERQMATADAPMAWSQGRMSAYLEMLPSALKPMIKQNVPWSRN
ncbi:MAG: CHAD domain-containing protein [Fluviibacter sp.]